MTFKSIGTASLYAGIDSKHAASQYAVGSSSLSDCSPVAQNDTPMRASSSLQRGTRRGGFETRPYGSQLALSQSLFEKFSPLLLGRFQQFRTDLRRSPKFVDPVITIASLDHRHRARRKAGFFFILVQQRIDY